jgi:hypothetical protein
MLTVARPHQRFQRINNDLLKSKGWSKTKIENLCRKYLEEGKSVVVDNMNANKIQRNPWVAMGLHYKVRGATTAIICIFQAVFHLFHPPLPLHNPPNVWACIVSSSLSRADN